MQVLLDQVFPRTADQLRFQLSTDDYRDAEVQIWLFEDLPKRRSLRGELMALGVTARVFSAYKPLLHFFLDEIDHAGLLKAHIVYPRHAACVENRYLLEAYPLTDLFPELEIEFMPAAEVSEQAIYRLELIYGDRSEEHQVFAPNALHDDFLGNTVYSPCAWLRIDRQGDVIDTVVQAEYQQAYQAVMDVITRHNWGSAEPYFKHLTIDLGLPGIERILDCGQEHISTIEAMHEEIYFSLLEYFQHHSGRPAGSRGLQPGQIIPRVRLDEQGRCHVRITSQPPERIVAEAAVRPPASSVAAAAKGMGLADADRPLSFEQIERSLQSLPGQHFAMRSSQGRAVNAVYLKGTAPAVLISGAQHANETSGVVGALRAAEQLKNRPDAHFALIPVENPDGYALHLSLCVEHPAHMHHAARYTALGDDLEYRERPPWYERGARLRALSMSQAQLHLNLHGYPAHEWTRPCTGYLPRGFESWSIPKGFFLILRHKAPWRLVAMELLQHVMKQLAGDAPLMAYNAAQLQRYGRYCAAPPFQVEHGIPYTVAEAPDQGPGITLITEFPDETIYGDAFSFAHTVQMKTVMLASEWWWANAPVPLNQAG